jgi:putative PIN family toxin of toxin-antitoxin system
VADWKVVADSNVLISALLWTGSPHKLLKLAENKAIILYSSLPIIEELSDVLARDKFADRINELKTTPEELIESLLNNIEIIRPAVSIKAIKSDPDDNKILECAVEAGAGNRDPCAGEIFGACLTVWRITDEDKKNIFGE